MLMCCRTHKNNSLKTLSYNINATAEHNSEFVQQMTLQPSKL